MYFPPSFFEDEVRDGFYVSGKMKRFWAGQLEVLDQIDKVCKRHNLTYFGDYGTILGAVRHGGFVPWDDDLDIGMKRDELNLFIKYARAELPEEYCVFDFETEPEYDNLLIRVVGGRSITFDPEYLSRNQGCPYAVGVDIFPLDNVAPTKELEEKQVAIIKYCIGLAQTYRATGEIPQYARMEMRKLEKDLEMHFKAGLHLDQKLFMIAERIMATYNHETTEYITNMGNYLENPNHIFPAHYFDQVVYLPFEGFMLPVSACYDDLLKRKYGDYMKPVRGFSAHDYPGFVLQDEAMKEAVGGIWCGYQMDAGCLEYGERMEASLSDIQKSQQEILGVLQSAKQMILTILQGEHPEEVLPLLEQCQNLAEQLGNLFEGQENEDTKIEEVSYLERYCEQVYTLYQVLVGELEVEGDFEQFLLAVLDEQQELLKQIVVSPRRKVLFVASRAKNWCYFDKLWQDEMLREDTDVYVMPVPWYEKDILGNLGTMHLEKEDFPDKLRILSYDQVSIESLSPDVIYTQDPYGNCTAGTSIHPYFYSERIRKFTRELVYIPPFELDEITDGDERGQKAVVYCCNVPGVLWADRIILQSKAMKKVYVENLTEYAGEGTREIWEQRIAEDDQGIYQHAREYRNLMKGTASGTTDAKKCLCFHMSSAVFLQKKQESIAKLSQVIDIFSENKEKLDIYWWEDLGMLDNLKGSLGGSDLERRYLEQVDRFKKLGLGQYKAPESRDEVLERCDAYYGDGSYIMNLFARAKKPVMQMNIEM